MKKHINTIFLSFLLISFSLLFNSCEKKKRDNLQGEWLLVHPDLEKHDPIVWAFNSDNTLEIQKYGKNISGTYTLDLKTAESFMDIEVNDLNIDGRYRLHKVDDEELYICRIIHVDGKSDHRWKEFIRN